MLYADNPLISPETLRLLLQRRARGDAGLALLAMRPDVAHRYGMVLTENDYVTGIVEWAEASDAERAIGLCNAGVLCGAAADMTAWLQRVRPDNSKGEYYLGDLVTLARADGRHVAAVEAPYAELRGINTRVELPGRGGPAARLASGGNGGGGDADGA